MAKSAVGILSNLAKLKHNLTAKLPEINFLDLRYDNGKERLEENNVKVIIADFDLLGNMMYDLPPCIRWVQGTWAGADKLFENYNSDKKLHYTVTRFSGFHFGAMMAEYVISNLIVLERNFFMVKKNQENQLWDDSEKIADYRVIADLNIGVLGVGAIGKHVASTLKTLGAAQIWGLVSKIPEKKEPFIDFYRTVSEVDEILSNCHVVVNILPHTAETAGLLNKNNLSACKGTIFINVGRGSIISEEDLVESLNKNYFSAAVLDVFKEEPLHKKSALWQMEQVIITPHVAAVTRTKDLVEAFIKNWVLWQDGKVLQHVINFDKGY